MRNAKLRQAIALEAARLMYERVESEYFTAKRKAAKRTEHLREMRLEALRLMRLLRAFKPRLIGSVMTGHVRKGSDIDVHVFSDSAGLITHLLENEGFPFDLERKQIVKHGESRVFTHI